MRLPIRIATVLIALTCVQEASADLIVPGIRRIPLELTLTRTGAMRDRAIVLFGCNSNDGRHTLAFPEPDKPQTCGVKQPPEVFLAMPNDVQALRALVARDLGWGQEGMDGHKLLEQGARSCGRITEKTAVGDGSKLDKVQARYMLSATDAECSLTKVSLQPGIADADAAAPPASSPAGPAPSNAAMPGGSAASVRDPVSAAPAKSGCSGCSAGGSLEDSGWPLALLLGFALRRRRPRHSAFSAPGQR